MSDKRPESRLSRGLHHLGKVVKIPTDIEIADLLYQRGIRTGYMTACSVDPGLDRLWRDRAKEGLMEVIYAPNEHSLGGMATGDHLATGEIPFIHSQNSGLFNGADGIVTHARAYEIPLLAITTWRGSTPDDESEPHQIMGDLTEEATELIFGKGRSFGTRLGTERGLLDSFNHAIDIVQRGGIATVRLSPGSFKSTYSPGKPEVVRGSPEEYKARIDKIAREKGSDYGEVHNRPEISRDDAIDEIAQTNPDAALVTGNGYNSRAVWGRIKSARSFPEAGYMGGAMAIAWGIARNNPHIKVVAIDGEGNAEMSNMAVTLFQEYPDNLYWYILDNGIAASVGTAPNPPLAPFHYTLARVIRTKPESPGEFKYPRVGKGRDGFTGGLPQIAKEFRWWIKEQTLINQRMA